MPPTIGIACSLGYDTDGVAPRPRMQLLDGYTEAVFAAGGTPHPLPIPRTIDDARLDQILDSIDGLIFTGGFDVHPRYYCDEPVHSASTLCADRRAEFDLALFRRADARQVPTLAICLGMQVAHIARGGRLIQHVDDLPREAAVVHYLPQEQSAYHNVRIASESCLAAIMQQTEPEVNSRHHQVVHPEHMGRGLQPVAWAPDGILEGCEDCDGRFLVGVQWHPENLLDRPEHLRLFSALVEAAG